MTFHSEKSGFGQSVAFGLETPRPQVIEPARQVAFAAFGPYIGAIPLADAGLPKKGQTDGIIGAFNTLSFKRDKQDKRDNPNNDAGFSESRFQTERPTLGLNGTHCETALGRRFSVHRARPSDKRAENGPICRRLDRPTSNLLGFPFGNSLFPRNVRLRVRFADSRPLASPYSAPFFRAPIPARPRRHATGRPRCPALPRLSTPASVAGHRQPANPEELTCP